MKVHGHPWSINTRKVLMVFAEKGSEAELALVMLPRGEHKRPEHLSRHPFGKVPVLEDGDFVVYETQAINRFLDRTLGGPVLTPGDPRGAALVDQWIGVADAYFAPHAQPLIVETLFRRYLGGEPDVRAREAGREGMQPALDAADRWLAARPYFAGDAFSLADIQWLPYFEYFVQTGAADFGAGRKHLASWWERASSRDTWQRVARRGPQPYEPGMTADVIERLYRR